MGVGRGNGFRQDEDFIENEGVLGPRWAGVGCLAEEAPKLVAQGSGCVRGEGGTAVPGEVGLFGVGPAANGFFLL